MNSSSSMYTNLNIWKNTSFNIFHLMVLKQRVLKDRLDCGKKQEIEPKWA